MNVKPERKSDLQILEFQRFDEYLKLMEALRFYNNKDKAGPYEGELYSSNDSGTKKPAQEHLQILLSENMKKWNQLIMNLHTEVSLTKSSAGFDEIQAGARHTHSRGYTPLKTSASDTMLYSRYEEPRAIPSASSSSNNATTSSSPKSKDHSGTATPPMAADQGDGLIKRQPPTRRMGFGFRNIGKNPSAIFQLVNNSPTGYAVDADNISTPPSPHSSVHSPTPSSPSTSPTSSPPSFHFHSRTPSFPDLQSPHCHPIPSLSHSFNNKLSPYWQAHSLQLPHAQ
jgi:hypothetical protein